MPSAQHELMVRAHVAALRAQPTASLAQLREQYHAFAARFCVPHDVDISPYNLDGIIGEWVDICLRAPSRIILYLHGGGYILGSSRAYREFNARLSRATRCRVLCIDYRLAPEHPFPAGLDDACTAYDRLLHDGADPASIVVGGDSAGAGLALGLILRLRDQGRPLPRAAFFLSAFLDLSGSGASTLANAWCDPLVTPQSIAWSARLYAPNDLISPYASPIFGDFHGLPRLLFLVGACETLLDDSRRAAMRARDCGGSAELVVEEGLTHAWPIFGSDLPESAASLRQIAEFI